MTLLGNNCGNGNRGAYLMAQRVDADFAAVGVCRIPHPSGKWIRSCPVGCFADEHHGLTCQLAHGGKRRPQLHSPNLSPIAIVVIGFLHWTSSIMGCCLDGV